jgi:hypothetical protein
MISKQVDASDMVSALPTPPGGFFSLTSCLEIPSKAPLSCWCFSGLWVRSLLLFPSAVSLEDQIHSLIFNCH